jgi:hypothetical protein
MPLAPSCLDFVGAQLYVQPYHGWGWRRFDDSSVIFDYAAIEQAGGFSFTVAGILAWRGELRHITGTIQTEHPLFAGCWISCALMQKGTFDFQSRLCLRYDFRLVLRDLWVIGPKLPREAPSTADTARLAIHKRRSNSSLRTWPPDLTNRSSQPLAIPKSSFCMTSTLNSVAKLAPASGG